MEKIEAWHTGKLSPDGVGRVGERKRGRCRPRRYWAIFEFAGPGVGRVERTDLGKFKTRRAANQFLVDYAKEYHVKIWSHQNEQLNPDNGYIDIDLKQPAP